MKIALLGDIALLGKFSIKKNPEIIEHLKGVADYLSKFDMVVGNLETPFSIKKKPHGAKSAYLQTDVENIEILKALNISAVTIANNHIFDYGKEGFDITIKTLEDNGIKWFGADGRDLKIEKSGNKILFSGFCCYSTNPLKISRKMGNKGLNPFNVKTIKEILKRTNKEGWFNIMSVHAGIEHVNTPSIDQIKISREFAEIAPYVYYGHHPHVIQGIDNFKESIVAHSLGNFCFSGHINEEKRIYHPLSENNKRGMILELEIENNKIINFNTKIVLINEDGSLSLSQDKELVNEFSDQIKMAFINPDNYNEKRKRQRLQYINSRRELRNYKWFMKRLRPRYFRLLIGNVTNKRKYIQNVLK